MQKVQAGHTSPLGELYERHKEGLFAYFYRCSRDRYLSEDLVQNVFIKVLKYKDQFKGAGAFNYWLYRIARNTWLDTVKKNEPKALDMISHDKKDAIILSRYHGLDYKTIAEMSDCTENAIKSRVMRGLAEIREIVKAS